MLLINKYYNALNALYRRKWICFSNEFESLKILGVLFLKIITKPLILS